jgi:galactokinase
MVDGDELAGQFERAFGRLPQLYRAPGRVNLIGEHTDYNDGFVMPMALDRSTWIAAAPRDDAAIVVRSLEFDEAVTIDGTRHGPKQGHWSDYVRGVAAVLDARGADLLIASDVPIGAGLSSSAALEVACGYALLDLANREILLDDLARACQRAEHEFVGTRCGIMDQTIACYGREDHALMLDTRNLEQRYLPLPPTVRVLVCNTMVRHQLASGEYNARRADCEEGVRVVARRYQGVRALRDVTLVQLDSVASQMPDRVYRRCRHVIGENARVQVAANALEDLDFEMFGRMMNSSHQSLRDDYEVSCAELDTMAEITGGLEGVHGARMTGGGFGGCAIALVDADQVERVQQTVAERYEQATRVRPDIWVCAAGSGVGSVPLRASSA